MKTTTKSIKSCLTQTEYEATLPFTNISTKSKEIVYGIMVEGKQLKYYSDKFGVSHSAINQTCKRFLVAFNKMRKTITRSVLPGNYEFGMYALPGTRALEIKKWQANTQIDMSTVFEKVLEYQHISMDMWLKKFYEFSEKEQKELIKILSEDVCKGK